MRKLVTVQKITNIIPIDGADSIELAQILGWQCVVKKDKFKIGDWCIYFEIDSFLPIEPKYEFLRSNCYKKLDNLGEGFRIRTRKFRGQISQGLVMPLEDMDIYQESDKTWKYSNEIGHSYFIHPELEEDLTRIFNVQKYEPPIPTNLGGVVAGVFPSFIPKTDQERIQSAYKDNKDKILGQWFEVTVKLDGASMTVYKQDGHVGVCSRNWELDITSTENVNNSYVRFSKESKILENIPEGFAVQGELYGLGIQGNRDNLKSVQFFVFDVHDINSGKYLTPEERHEFFIKYLLKLPNISHVPVEHHTYYAPDTATEAVFVHMADNAKSINNPVAEGLVFKRLDGKYSFKAISNAFLVKED